MSKADEAERAAEIERRRVELAAGTEMVKQAVAAKVMIWRFEERGFGTSSADHTV